ncbi:MAG: signal recognition particle-docking protein FtsY [Nanoarchaeota archaeon]|nr:signal recognition particle-docking protein FtsY [Nanoarchaeota archaeon]
MFNSFKDKLKNLFKASEASKEEKPKIKSEKTKPIIKKKKQTSQKKEKQETKSLKTKPVKKQVSLAQKKSSSDQPAPKEKIQEVVKEKKQEIEYLIDKVEEKVKEEKPGKNIFQKITGKFSTVTLDQKTFDEFFEKLEMLLLENNVALEVIDIIKEAMSKKLLNLEIKKSDLENEIKNALKESIYEILIPPFDLIEKIKNSEGHFIILFFGINGSGKTTSIAKVANLLKKHKISSVFAAADTFRAASIEQLIKHGENLNVKVINQTYGADSASVGFDAIQYAKSHGIKTVLIDTAGRMHTKDDLLREMEKIIRVTNPNLKIFVAESITGNDATEQSKIFNETFNLDCTILTKADVDEKGGTAISIGHITNKPILFLGTGQEYDDLELFDPKEILVKLGLEY